jgi:2-octaprenyl-6-methoxyphenol hydroxylase
MFDVLIVGGGMVGASLACALGSKQNNKSSSLRVGLIETKADFLRGEFGADGRASAVAFGSSQIWQQIGIWSGMVQRGVTPMHLIQISDQDFGWRVQLKREQIQREALGYVVENAVTLAAAWEFMQQCANIELICPAAIEDIEPGDRSMSVKISSSLGEQYLETKLLVAADGGRSPVRQLAKIPIQERGYDQTCIVLSLKLEHSHQNIAYERFQASGPFAILPLSTLNCAQNSTEILAETSNGDRCCVVWTATNQEAPDLLKLDQAAFMVKLRERFGQELSDRLGHFELEAPPASYNPRWMHSQTYVKPRLVLIGDAAHCTHPVAGQGMNLGIRDAGALAEILQIADRSGEDLGSLKVLNRYQKQRRWDNFVIIWLTDVTNRLFSNQILLLKLIRRFGLAIANWQPLKQLIMYLMMGLLIRQPSLSPDSVDSPPISP